MRFPVWPRPRLTPPDLRTPPSTDLSTLAREGVTDIALRQLPPSLAKRLTAELHRPGRPQTLDDAEAEGLFVGMGWEYVASPDACDRCIELHGTRFASLAEVYAVLPNFGPNPDCRKGSACGCTALPIRLD